MKILQVNCVYNTGSTGKIVYDVHTELVKAGHESVVCYGRGRKTADKNVYKTCSEWYAKLNNLFSRISGIMYGGCFFSTNNLIRIIRKENPDIVHLHCINGYFVNIYRLITWLKKNNVKTVLTLHAEFMHTANCGHAFECEKYKTGCGKCPHFKKETKSILFDNTALSFKKMKKAFDGFNNNLVVTSVSPWLMDRAQNSIILGDKNHTVVMNGLDTSVFYPHGADEIRKKHNLDDKKFVLFVTPIFSTEKNHIKGGWYLIELAKRMPEVVFGVVGAREQYDNLPKNVINIGRVDNQDTLAKYYSAANATILLSKRETFSMVTAESLCCATAVVGFKAGGPETISIDEFCSFVPYGDIDDIQNKLEQKLSCQKDERISQKAASKYDKRAMANSYLNTYSELLNRKKKILQVNVVYKKGSTGKIINDIHTELLNQGYDSLICYGRGKKIKERNVCKTCSEWYAKLNNLFSRISGIMYGGCLFSTNNLIRIIKKENPDIVHLHCINGYFVNIYRLITWLKENNVKTVLTLHAEFMHTANCGYALDCEKWRTGCGNCPRRKKETKSWFFDGTAKSFQRMKKAFEGFNDNLIVTSVSSWLMDRAQNSIILGDKNHTVVMNGLDTSVFYPHGADEIRKKHNLDDKKFVLFVTPIFSTEKNHIKGGWYLIELAKRMPEVVFGVIGAREQYDNLPKNVINIGRVDNQDTLAKYYSAANATVLLSKKETFSMVTAESLCCGTAVVGFKAGGPETISIDEFCSFVPYGDIDALKDAVNIILNTEMEDVSAEAIARYKKQTMTSNYVKIYEKTLGEKHS